MLRRFAAVTLRWAKALVTAPLWIRIVLFAAIASIVLFWREITHLSDPVIDLLLYILGGVLTDFVASFGGHVATNKPLHRWTFYVSGLLLGAVIIASGIRNYRTAVRTITPEQIVMEAVNTSNIHTDSEIGIVREDLKKVQKHSDDQIGTVRDDVRTIGTLLSKSATDLGVSISKIGKPEPPTPAVIKLVLWASDTNQVILHPDNEGVVLIEFAAYNTSSTTARSVDVWIDICDGCSFAKEPSGFDKPAGMREQTRHALFSLINPRTSLPKQAISVKAPPVLFSVPPKFASEFKIGFRYSCEVCGVPDIQLATIRTSASN